MVRHGIDDIRLFYENDLRFLEQFARMKVPLSWLREYVPVEVEPQRLAEDLTAAGLAVDAIETRGRGDRPRARHHHEPRRLHERLRRGPRGGGPLRPAAAAARHLGPARREPPASEALDVDDRGPRPLRALLRAGPRREGRPVAGLAARPARARGHPLDQQPGRPHELRDDRDGPAEPRLRPRPACPAGSSSCAGRARARGSTTLDGVERALPARVGVIAGQGGEPALALAGIMGGASSEIGEDTRVGGARGRLVGARSRCAARRGPSGCTRRPPTASSAAPTSAPAPAPSPAWRTSSRRSAPARCGPGLVERKGHERPARTVRLRPARVSALLGVEVPRLQQVRTLESLGFLVSGSGPEADRPRARPGASTSRARRTSRRRWAGTSGCTGSRPRCRRRPGRAGSGPRSGASGAIRDVLTGVGLVEVVNYAFVAGAQVDAARPRSGTRLANPLTEEQDTLRTSLVMPGLARHAAHQPAARPPGRGGLRAGPRLRRGRSGAPREERRLAVLLSGSTQPAPLVDEAAAVRPLRPQGRRRAALRPARRAGPRRSTARARRPPSSTPAGR